MHIYDRQEERTGVQESCDWRPEYDIQCDFVMVYGFHNLAERIAHYKARGYVVHLMTGVSWGNYQDYLNGKFDGIKHFDEGQTATGNQEINHNPGVPYMVPSVSFSHYLAENLKKAVDAGVEAIHLEEPEFWVHAGYSPAFKREWEIYYKEPWQDPESSADGQFRASKLKRYLYTRTLDRLCAELKEYAAVKYGRILRFYVPTHSLVNYSQWRIVSPESALVDLPTIDGYIAQIWTGTARVPNSYRGVVKERTFETAFFEYGIMQELVRNTGRKMWFLHDPIEDDPKHTWKDYRNNYYRTVTASLFQSEIRSFEVSPWPSRVMLSAHPGEDGKNEETIPAAYKTNLLTVMHTLSDMANQPARMLTANPQVGVLLADSAMYQRRYPADAPDAERGSSLLWSPFYGLAMPLLKDGAFVCPVQLDNIRRYADYLDKYKILVLSYEFMKPDFPDLHNAIAQWVRDGGILFTVGDGRDVFHTVRAWWNQGNAHYRNPMEHLLEALGLGRTPVDGNYPVGKGMVGVCSLNPGDVAENSQLCDVYLRRLHDLLAAAKKDYNSDSRFLLRRGPYVVAAHVDNENQCQSMTIPGTYIDLYTSDLTIRTNPTLSPGEVGLYIDLSAVTAPIEILAVSGRIFDYRQADTQLSFGVKGPNDMRGKIRLKCPPPTYAVATDQNGSAVELRTEYDNASGTAFLSFDSDPAGVYCILRFQK